MSSGKRPSTQFGEPLSDESRRLVREVRRQLCLPIHQNFDTDFNIYRFVANAERSQKGGRKEIVETASKALNQHLRVRKCLQLDDLPDVPFEQNRLFRENFMPHGPILDGTDAQNRLLWFIEYRSLSVETIAHGIRSSESIRCQFWQFEHMLRRVNQQERQSGRLSSIRHIIDMTGYEINPFTMIFVSSGTLSYYSQLLHYDNYPELVYPIEMVNIARWIQIPYRLIKGMMPAGFTDRFRLHDGNFLEMLSNEIPIEHIPQSIGGQNSSVECIPAQRLLPSQYWQPAHPHLLDQLESLHIGPKKAKMFRIQIEPGLNHQYILSWYFRTDGDIYFGLFFEPLANKTNEMNSQMKENRNGGGHRHAGKDGTKEILAIEQMEATMEWAYPMFKLTAKLHHEWDCVDCSRPGNYWLLFSNRHSWLHHRTVEVLVHLERANEGQKGGEGWTDKRIRYDGTEEEEIVGMDSNLRQTLKMYPDDIFGLKAENRNRD